MSNDSKTFGEQYASAAGATDLTLDNNRQGHIDRVAAMGCAANRHSAGHRIARSMGSRSATDIRAALTESERIVRRIATRRGRAVTPQQVKDCARHALALVIAPACKACNGTGHVKQKTCRRCDGSGQEPMPKGDNGLIAEVADCLNAAKGAALKLARDKVR
jgi:hypothetical protein